MVGRIAIAAAAVMVLVSACATRTTATGEVSMSYVTGTIGYRERIALPPGATITVRLVDVSRADAPAIVLGEQIIEARGRQPPFAFQVPYDAAQIDPRMTYAVQGRIESDGRLRFISDRHYPVLTRGATDRVDLLLKQVGAGSD